MTCAGEFTEFATGNGRIRHVVNEWSGTAIPISTAAGPARRPIPGIHSGPGALVIAP